MSHLKSCLLFLTFLVTTMSSAQKTQSKNLHGKLISEDKLIAGADIVNLVNQKATISDNQGNFYIEAKAGDLLVISGKNYEYMRYSVDDDDLIKDVLTINLIPKAIQLEETVVNQYSHINARALGIIPANQKVYTPAEAKLAAATSGPVDLVVNLINGKIGQRKKEVEIEKKEFLLERLDILYTDKFYTAHLKIPEDQIAAFKFFAADDKELAQSVASKNKSLIEFDLSRLANQYLKFE